MTVTRGEGQEDWLPIQILKMLTNYTYLNYETYVDISLDQFFEYLNSLNTLY